MKKLLLLATLVLGVVSCMKDQPVEAGLAGDGNVVLSVALPADATRAAGQSSAVGAIDNRIDLENTYDIRYILEVFDANKTLAKRVENFEDTATETTFELRLIPGRHYTFVVWADFVNQGSEDGLHYLAESLRNVTLIGNQNAMDESRDAYTAVFNTADNNGDVFSSASQISMTLRRPFAKLRVVTNDMQEIYSQLDKATVVYTSEIYKMYDALTTVPSEAVHVEKAYNFDATTAYANEADEDCEEKTLFADYLLGTETGTVQFVMTVTDEVQTLPAIAFNTNIPVERNHLTTIYGPVLTDFNRVTVRIDDDFAEPENVVDVWDGVTVTEPSIETNDEGETVAVIDSASDLAWLAGFVNGTQASTFATRGAEVVNFVLGADIDLGNHPWTPIGTAENNFVGTFDGNGHTIGNLNILVEEAKEGKVHLGLIGFAKDATIKNLTIANVDINVACLDIDHSQGHIGAVVGSLEGTSTIENVTVKGDIFVEATPTANGASRVAVVVGGNTYANVTLKNVHVEANEGSYLRANNNTGAIAGQLQGKTVYENCSSNIDVTVNKFFAGGIVGLAGTNDKFINCHTTGNIAVVAGREGRHNDEFRVGGIAGGWADGKTNVCTLENCSYTGKVSGKNSDGSVAEPLDYAGYVGRGYALTNCAGSKVVIDGTEYVQAFSNVYGVYYVNGELVLSTPAAFNAFAKMVNDGTNYFEGVTVKLGADIDLAGQEWTPIGSAVKDHGFMGNFDGNGYAIKNLAIKNIALGADGYAYAGLFGVTEGVDENNQNTIKNLTIENVNIETEGHIVAAAVAYPYYTKLENILVKGNVSIKGGDYTSGVLAYTRRCVDAKNIAIEANAGSSVEGNKTVGGVISDIQLNGGLTANYSNFKASGLTVKGAMHVGGIAGIIGRQTLTGATVENVTIESNDVRKGILVGSLGEVSVINGVSVNNVVGAENLVGATFSGENSNKVLTIDGVKYVYNDGWCSVGTILTLGGQKAVVYSVDNGVKAVSVEEKNLNGKNATDAAAWAEGLGEGWNLASIYELDAIHASRFALNKALAADSADNALFCETEYYTDGKYALYISSTDAEGNDPQGQAYFSNRVHVKYFNLNGYWDYNYSTFATISKYAPLKDNYFARAVYAL